MVSGGREACRWLREHWERGERRWERGGEGSGWSQGRIKEAETPSFYPKRGRGHPSPSGGQCILQNLSWFSPSPSTAARSLAALAGRAPPPTCPPAPPCLSPQPKAGPSRCPWTWMRTSARCSAVAPAAWPLPSATPPTTRRPHGPSPGSRPPPTSGTTRTSLRSCRWVRGCPALATRAASEAQFRASIPSRAARAPQERGPVRPGPAQGAEGHRSGGSQDSPGLR